MKRNNETIRTIVWTFSFLICNTVENEGHYDVIRHTHSYVPSHEVVFPVHWTTFVPAILSHFLSIDPVNS